MRITLESLRILDAIDRNDSFAEAADELNRVPSALSYAVRKIEESLKVKLFDREGYRVRLTTIGQELLRGGRLILQQAQALEVQIMSGKPAEPQTIALAYDDFLRPELIVSIMQAIVDEYPSISLRLSAEVLNGSWDAIITGRADVAIGANPDIPLEISSKHLSRTLIPSVFVVAPGHPLTQEQEPLTPARIQEYRTVLAADTSQQLPKKSSGYIPGQSSIVVPTIQAKLHVQLAGLGVGFLPRYLAWPYIQSGQLIEIPVQRPKPGGRLAVAWHPERKGETVTKIIEIITEKCGGLELI
jgi:DNA-binding transcriptional LysR family regulator